ncbi:MAG: ATP-NAD kinase family protein [Thermoprotei archaeon]
MGFIVNPIAGMGGSVGLKGTDGYAYYEAIKRGAKPIAPRRALEFLNSIRTNNFIIYTANKQMGLDIVTASKHANKVSRVFNNIGAITSAEDTKRIACAMVENGIDILVFVGGDGTARDIYEAVDGAIPVLGVPSGVKMYSAVFATSPRAAARVFEEFVKGNVVILEREVLDIDEEAFRKDELRLKLYGYLKVPIIAELIQSSKSISTGLDEEENKIAIARYIVENMEHDTVYILGPGSTVKAINKVLGLPATLLGVDVIYNSRLIAKDVWEKQLLEILSRYDRAKIIVTPIGGQGFILGRGNQQITPRIIKRVGVENIIIIATRKKISELDVLRVDTGDPELDRELCGYRRVLVDYNTYIVKKVVCS